MKVFVYFNLHKKVWSVRDVKTGRVVNHTNFIILKDAKFKVSAAGRARVLKEKRKNVHAGVQGEIVEQIDIERAQSTKVTYNPYKYKSFVTDDTHKEVKSAPYAIMAVTTKPHVYAIGE